MVMYLGYLAILLLAIYFTAGFLKIGGVESYSLEGLTRRELENVGEEIV